MHWYNKFLGLSVAGVLSLVIAGSTAQTPTTIPTVDLSIGPVAVNSQAVNVALALSVEFPTVGSAYRRPDYEHATTYLGYFDPKGCYDYKDATAGAPLSGEYFFRTGNTDASGFCNTPVSGVGYSGNALNYVTTSSIDLLRFALTGGDRVADTATTTVLGRAYLRNSWQLHDGTYFPAKRIPAAFVGKVTPDHGAIDVYGGGCWDRVWFGTANTSRPCDNPGTSGNLNKTVPDPASTTTAVVSAGAPAPTGGVFQTTVFSITNPRQTATFAPTEGPVTFTDVTVLGGGTSTTPPPNVSTATSLITITYVANGGSTTTTPTAPVPQVITGTTTATFAVRNFQSFVPASGPFRTFQMTSSTNVCRTNSSTTNPGPFMGLLTASGTLTGVPSSSCGSGVYSGFGSRGNISNTLLPMTVYEPYNVVNQYATFDAVPVYRDFTIRRDYDVYVKQDVYTVFGSKVGVMFARVKVCDDSEKTTRTDLCQRYPDGNYKPVGEVQRKSEGVRVAAFGYLKDDTTARYGGVLRAPMKYPGPVFRDPNGVVQTNAATEWNANNGVFTVDPLGESPTYARSGVINYLNKFGTTGAVQGYYKSFDPVGELYYEALRYFQGLGPTAAATSGLDATLADGYPVYTPTKTGAKWEDPLQNACERRNFILAIGDVNTHRDRQLPGYGGNVGSDLAADPARAVELIPGSSPSQSFDATFWTARLTGFETNVSRSYTDALGRTQTTLGNPNPNANNTNLEGKGTGSGSTSGYFWAGAAYWANTQPIRYDTKNGESMKDVRVKTFTIDVDEGGNGDIEDTNIRGIKPRRSSFYLAGKYGWFSDPNQDGNPFTTSGGVTNNSEWQDPTAPNTPDGYVIASQAQKLIDGIRKFFNAAANEKGAVSVSALSSQRFTSKSPNGDSFAPRFDTRDWSGTVERTTLVLNTTTQKIESQSGVVWDAGRILTSASETASPTVSDPFVKPASRNIITFSRDTALEQGVVFDVANKGSLDAAVQSALAINPATGLADTLADQRINWLRGDRTNEQSSAGGTLRRRNGILGDIINSGPVFKQGADPDIVGEGYLGFTTSVVNRTAVVYVGANDGMLHAFRAGDGKELFAYMPRAVSADVARLTDPAYVHRPYVDGVPAVREARIGTDWKTVLVSGMGGGAQGIFALDVTNPTAFGASNVLFEFTDRDDPDMGNVLSQPKIVMMKVPGSPVTAPPTYKWFVAVSSGYNNYKNDGNNSATGQQALFLLSLDKGPGQTWQEGTNYFKVVLPAGTSTAANGLSNPGVVTGDIGEVLYMYAGDLQGNLWKFDFSDGVNASNVANAVFKSGGVARPIFTATDAFGNRQPITTAPLAVAANAKGFMVVVGTGKFMEPSDSSSTGVQGIYGIWDSLETTAANFTVPKNKLFNRTAVEGTSTVSLGTGTFVFGFSTGQYRGWYFDLPGTRERISVEGDIGIGLVALNSTIPEGSCSGDGNGREYLLNPVNGIALNAISVRTNVGLLSKPNIIEIDLGAYSTRDPRGFRKVLLKQGVVTTGTKITDAGNVGVSTANPLAPVEIPGGRISWRELRN